MSIEIKNITAKDYDAKVKLDKEAYSYHVKIRPDIIKLKSFKQPTKGDFEEQIKAENYFGFGIYIDDNLVGFAEGSEKKIFDHDVVFVNSLCVSAEYRGNGFGMALMKHVEEFAKSKNSYVELSAWVGNDAINFYKKLGYKEQRIYFEKKVS